MSKKPEEKVDDRDTIIDELLEKLHYHMPSHEEADAVVADVNKRLGREAKEE